MEQSTAQRRLVKSPPELWAEVSSEEALGRHLAPFGEIRITRVEPETTVAWEGERASGTVELEPAGWGTKVILTARPAEPEAASRSQPESRSEPEEASRSQPQPQPASRAQPQPESRAQPQPASRAQPESRPEPAPEPQAIRAAPQNPPVTPPAPQQPRRGFFARLFRRHPPKPVHAPAPAAPDCSETAPGPEPTPPEPDPAPTLHPPASAPVPVAAEPMPQAPAEPVPVAAKPMPQAPAEPVPVAAEPTPMLVAVAPVGARDLDAAQTVAILTEVLDDLGAAHHRPFSRD